jgi:superfamily II DNA helicase RecQ
MGFNTRSYHSSKKNREEIEHWFLNENENLNENLNKNLNDNLNNDNLNNSINDRFINNDMKARNRNTNEDSNGNDNGNDNHSSNSNNNRDQGKPRILVSTSSFGMGVDKSNIRAVIHFDLPLSVEDYVQGEG